MLDISSAVVFIADQPTRTNLAGQRNGASILDTNCDKSSTHPEVQGSGPYAILPWDSGRSNLLLRQMETLPIWPGSW